jgi:hypothetical protein
MANISNIESVSTEEQEPVMINQCGDLIHYMYIVLKCRGCQGSIFCKNCTGPCVRCGEKRGNVLNGYVCSGKCNRIMRKQMNSKFQWYCFNKYANKKDQLSESKVISDIITRYSEFLVDPGSY